MLVVIVVVVLINKPVLEDCLFSPIRVEGFVMKLAATAAGELIGELAEELVCEESTDDAVDLPLLLLLL